MLLRNNDTGNKSLALGRWEWVGFVAVEPDWFLVG